MDDKKNPFNNNVIKSKMMALRIQVLRKSSCKQQRRDLSCNHNDGNLFTCEDIYVICRLGGPYGEKL